MLIPLPPWCFPNARVLYQPCFIPVAASRAVIPSLEKKNEAIITTIEDEDMDDKYLSLLSLFGWTLGGLFVVDWTDSPIGPYREVAVLSGLVIRSDDWFGGIGAWASHIVVNTEDAVESGRRLFGLPAVLGSIDFSVESEKNDRKSATPTSNFDGIVGGWMKDTAADIAIALKYAIGAAVPKIAEPAEILNKERMPISPSNEKAGFVWNAENCVNIIGWNGWRIITDNNEKRSNCDDTTFLTHNHKGGISLPSFSGLLAVHHNNGRSATKRSPLLKYPLRIASISSIKLRPAMKTKVTSSAKISKELRSVLVGGICASPCIQLDDVLVVAGEPTIIAS